MALVDFIYRCPGCGQDPTEGEGAEVRCPACRRVFRPAPGNAGIRVIHSGESEDLSPAEIRRRIEALGGALTLPASGDGASVTPGPTPTSVAIRREARATMRLAAGEEPVYHQGRLLGFAERLGAPREGRLVLEGPVLRFVGGAGKGEILRLELADVRALQGSSSSVQLSPRSGGVAVFRFHEDSPRRWEELLAAALRRVWRESGRGEIQEFQPRIRTR